MSHIYITGGDFNGGARRVRKFAKDGTQVAEFWPESAAAHGGPAYTGTVYNFTGGDTNADESLVFVADPTNGRVWKFDADLNLLGSIGAGWFEASTSGPNDCVVIGDALYVSQRAIDALSKWTFDGTLLASWPVLGITAFDIADDNDTVYYVRSWNSVWRFVISTGTDVSLTSITSLGALRLGAANMQVGNVTAATELDLTGGLVGHRYLDAGAQPVWGAAIDPDDTTKLWTVIQNTGSSPVHRIDLTSTLDEAPPSYTTFQWNADAEGFRDGWLFMRRRNAVNVARPRARGRHVPHPVRARGRERGVNPAAPRARGRQAT